MIDDVAALPGSLMIGIPAYTGQVALQTLRTVIETMQCCAALGVQAFLAGHAGCCYVDEARNDLARQFLASEADMLLFLDSDVGAEPTAIAKLLQARKAVVAGVYPKKSDPPTWPVVFDGPYLWRTAEGAVEAAGVPTGFLLLHREVFLALQPTVPVYQDSQGQTQYAYFQCEVAEGRYWGEDYTFCRRWRALGGRLWMVPDIGFEHVGFKAWSGDYHSWYAAERDECFAPGWFVPAHEDAHEVEAACSTQWPEVLPGGVLWGEHWAWPSVQAGVSAYFGVLPGDYYLEQVGDGWRIGKPKE